MRGANSVSSFQRSAAVSALTALIDPGESLLASPSSNLSPVPVCAQNAAFVHIC